MRNHLFLLTAIMFALSGAASLYAEEDNIPKEVPLASNPTKEGVFRSPGIAAITCYFLEGELTFIFSTDLGAVECEVVRLSDQTVYETIFYATNGGYDSLYVSTAADDYEITLTCADGTIYYGEYSVE